VTRNARSADAQRADAMVPEAMGLATPDRLTSNAPIALT
jgi:hypothetical protein